MKRLLMGIAGTILLVGCTSKPAPTVTASPTPTEEYITQIAVDNAITDTPGANEPVSAVATMSEPTQIPMTNADDPEPRPDLFFLAWGEWQQQHLWGVRHDGLGLRQIVEDSVSAFAVGPTSEHGTLLAYIGREASYDNDNNSLNLGGNALHLLSLPSEQDTVITPLTGEFAIFSEALENAISNPESLAWSPDGKWLAFVGAINGDTADVYSYELATGQIRWLTSGEDQADQVMWSPDSQWIVHTASADYGEGNWSHQNVTGTWAVRPEGGSIVRLDGRRPTYLIGWLDSETVVAHGVGIGPITDLRTINIRTGKVTNLLPNCFGSIAYSFEANVYLIGIADSDVERCNSTADWSKGSYLVTAEDWRYLSEDEILAYNAEWSSSVQMFLSREGRTRITAILTNGTIIENLQNQVPPKNAQVFDNGNLWVWNFDDNLYAASAPDYEHIRINGPLNTVRNLSAGWTPSVADGE